MSTLETVGSAIETGIGYVNDALEYTGEYLGDTVQEIQKWTNRAGEAIEKLHQAEEVRDTIQEFREDPCSGEDPNTMTCSQKRAGQAGKFIKKINEWVNEKLPVSTTPSELVDKVIDMGMELMGRQGATGTIHQGGAGRQSITSSGEVIMN